MSINLPEDATVVDARAKTDVQRELAGSNPFLKNHWLGAIVTAFANRIFDFYLQLNIFLLELFWNTSTGTFLEIQASWFGITRLAATQSVGNIVVTGTATTSIPQFTEFKTTDGLSFLTQVAAVIAAQSISVSSITRSGNTVTATTISDHGLASNVIVTMSGADQADYNGAQDIQVISANQFTYQITTAPTTPATGTILAAFTAISIEVQSSGFGDDNNLVLDTPLDITTPLIGVDNTANVDFTGLNGGADQESDSDLRTRFLDRVQNPVAHFNVSDIESKAKEINGVTRVFVEEVTPTLGQVTIYFMRDNDTNPIPSGTDITDVKNIILTIKPANTADADVIVAAPVAQAVNFVFTALLPDTATMKDAINASLAQFFSEGTVVGEDIEEDAYRSIIFNTIDPETGESVLSFTLSTPVGDISIADGIIGTLGSITYT